MGKKLESLNNKKIGIKLKVCFKRWRYWSKDSHFSAIMVMKAASYKNCLLQGKWFQVSFRKFYNSDQIFFGQFGNWIIINPKNKNIIIKKNPNSYLVIPALLSANCVSSPFMIFSNKSPSLRAEFRIWREAMWRYIWIFLFQI